MMVMISDLSMGRSTREEKTERREVKVVSLEYSSSVQWNILLGVITIITIRDVTMMTIIMTMICIMMTEWSPGEEVGLTGTLSSHQEEHR